MFIKSGLDNNILVCVCVCVCVGGGGGRGCWVLFGTPTPQAMALYNDALQFSYQLCHVILHLLSFIFKKPFKTRNHMQWRIIVPLVWDITFLKHLHANHKEKSHV